MSDTVTALKRGDVGTYWNGRDAYPAVVVKATAKTAWVRTFRLSDPDSKFHALAKDVTFVVDAATGWTDNASKFVLRDGKWVAPGTKGRTTFTPGAPRSYRDPHF